jgi:hypothetical protein
MAKAKKPTVKPTEIVHYYATNDEDYLNCEIYPVQSQEQAIANLREDEGEIEQLFMYEIKCIGKYKVNFTLEKIN